MSLCRFRETEVVVAVVSVGSASDDTGKTLVKCVSRRTRHPESASRRDTTIERRMRALYARRALREHRRASHRRGFFDIFSTVSKKSCRRPGHRGRVQPRSPRAPGGQPSARVRRGARHALAVPRVTLERARDSRKTETRRGQEHHGGRGRGADDARSRAARRSAREKSAI